MVIGIQEYYIIYNQSPITNYQSPVTNHHTLAYNAAMFRPFEAFIGLRYVRAKRRNHFISFVSLSSILGITLGITAVITVSSVMNGFEKEVQERTLEMVSHATLLERFGRLSNWREIKQQLELHPDVVAVAPYAEAGGSLFYKNKVKGVVIRGIVPEVENEVSDINGKLTSGDLNALNDNANGIVVGRELSSEMGVTTGDKLILVTGKVTNRQLVTVVGIFETGMYEYDNGLAVMQMDTLIKLLGHDSPDGLSIKTDDPMRAPYISREAAGMLAGQFGIIDWTQRNRNFFHALKTQKLVMFVILTLIIAVAAFNIIATLIMVVLDKQADIAILRTLGTSPRSIMKVFIVQGIVIGLLGMMLGDIIGIWLSGNIEGIVKAVETTFNVKILPCDVYLVCDFPSKIFWSDVIVISIVAFVLCLCATIYPAWRASRTQPAEALRYE